MTVPALTCFEALLEGESVALVNDVSVLAIVGAGTADPDEDGWKTVISGERLDVVEVVDVVDVEVVEVVSELVSEVVVSVVVVVVEVVGNKLGKVDAVRVGCVSGRAPDTESQI